MSIGESRVASTQRAIQINADVIGFLRNGGEIQQIPIGKSAQNLSAQAVANKARARERRARLMPRVLELKLQGKSHREIAAIIDVTHGTINNWVREEMSNEPG